MKKGPDRRAFLKGGAFLGGSSFFLGRNAQQATAEEKPKNPAADQARQVNETLKTIQSLRTIHGNFKDQAIPDETIDLIVHSCLRAANSSNMQTYSIVVVKDREKMRQVCTYAGSCMLLFCVDYTRLRAGAASLGHPYHPDNIVSFVTGSINASLAVQTAVIVAKSLGVDSLITNGIHRGDMERVCKLLDLPQDYCFPLIAVVLGYPTEEPDHLMGRLYGPGVIHREKYHQLTQEELERMISIYDDKERYLALNADWDKQGHKHYLDWLFKAWLGRSSKPTERETQMLQLLKRSRFVEPQKS